MIRIKRVDVPRSKAALLAKFHLEKGGLVQQTIDRTVIDYNQPYCPWRTGKLATSPYSATQIGSGKVVYPVSYARKMYYGVAASGRPIRYSTAVNALAGSFWLERMKADRLDDVKKEALNAARK